MLKYALLVHHITELFFFCFSPRYVLFDVKWYCSITYDKGHCPWSLLIQVKSITSLGILLFREQREDKINESIKLFLKQ